MAFTLKSLTNALSNFLPLREIDNTSAQTTFAAIDGLIDAGVTALDAASTRAEFNAVEQQYGYVAQDLGRAGFELGNNFIEDANEFNAIDRTLGATPSTAQTDFVAFNQQFSGIGADLHAYGLDIFKLSEVHSRAQLVTAVANLTSGATTLSGAFSALSGAATTFLGDVAAQGGALNGALVTAATPLEADFSNISGAFTALAGLVGGTSASTSTTPLGDAFATLNTDFLSLSHDLKGLAAPLANLVISASSPSPTTL